MIDDHLVLAGGGHTHALLLKKWCMYPYLKPKGLITLISRDSSTLYSGMIPGFIAGNYLLDDLLINLRGLADKAGVVFVLAEINSLSLKDNCLFLEDLPPIYFNRLSLNLGSNTLKENHFSKSKAIDLQVPIRPFSRSLQWIEKQDKEVSLDPQKKITVVGSGLSAIEVVFALRSRWNARNVQLKADLSKLKFQFKKALFESEIDIITREDLLSGPSLLCTGSKAPHWLEESNLPVDKTGRVLTDPTLQVINQPNIFAVGDCGVIVNNYRPASGVWAVRASDILAKNLERSGQKNCKLLSWRPQRKALQLIGGSRFACNDSVAWASWGGVLIGPNRWIWQLKKHIDKKFMDQFDQAMNMDQSKIKSATDIQMACRGCAAKLPAIPLRQALRQANLSKLGVQPEDAFEIASLPNGEKVFQSVDGFPALVSDPFLNGRLTTLHASSDLWSMGARVVSAQAVVTLPKVSGRIQQELLAQTLSGIKSALELQGAELIGGHTLEARSECPEPITLGIQIALCINGIVLDGCAPWTKGGLQLGDELLISRGLGSGVLFAAARAGKVSSQDLDSALAQLSTSQHTFLESILNLQSKSNKPQIIHSCTDITGFGLLGHLEEMLCASNASRLDKGLSLLRIRLHSDSLPYFKGVLSLFDNGFSSTLAPANRRAWRLLDSEGNRPAPIEMVLGEKIACDSREHKQILELIVDPQTCGPMVLSCDSEIAFELTSNANWTSIGTITSMDY